MPGFSYNFRRRTPVKVESAKTLTIEPADEVTEAGGAVVEKTPPKLAPKKTTAKKAKADG